MDTLKADKKINEVISYFKEYTFEVSMSGRRKYWFITVHSLQKRDGGFICQLCKQKITRFSEVTIDHILPRACGGGEQLYNKQLAHNSCNEFKGHKLHLKTSDFIHRKIKNAKIWVDDYGDKRYWEIANKEARELIK